MERNFLGSKQPVCFGGCLFGECLFEGGRGVVPLYGMLFQGMTSGIPSWDASLGFVSPIDASSRDASFWDPPLEMPLFEGASLGDASLEGGGGVTLLGMPLGGCIS